jgi:hypothetical protein
MDYQKLFEHMALNHDVILMESELQEIMSICNEIQKKKQVIILDEFSYECADGCCSDYGTRTSVNGVELPFYNQDAGTILEQVLTHLGYEVEVINKFNGEEI